MIFDGVSETRNWCGVRPKYRKSTAAKSIFQYTSYQSEILWILLGNDWETPKLSWRKIITSSRTIWLPRLPMDQDEWVNVRASTEQFTFGMTRPPQSQVRQCKPSSVKFENFRRRRRYFSRFLIAKESKIEKIFFWKIEKFENLRMENFNVLPMRKMKKSNLHYFENLHSLPARPPRPQIIRSCRTNIVLWMP